MNIYEFNAMKREMRKKCLPIAKQCFEQHRAYIDINGQYCNRKTNWFVCGYNGEAGIGVKAAGKLAIDMFRDRTGAVSCDYSRPVLENQLPALEYKRSDGMYMKLMFKYSVSKGYYIMFIDIHSQEENKLWDDYRKGYY